MPRIPRAHFPHGLAWDYYQKLRVMILRMVGLVEQKWNQVLVPAIIRYRMRRDAVGAVIRADDTLGDILGALDTLEVDLSRLFTLEVVERIAEEFVQGTVQYSFRQLGRQIRAVTGVDPLVRDLELGSVVQSFVRDNVALIKTIPSEYFGRIEQIVMNGVRKGISTAEMGRQIKDLGHSTDKRAKFIARDQAGSIYGLTTRHRCQTLGLEHFVWRTSLDERVRGRPGGKWEKVTVNHWKREGKVYSWEKGATDYGATEPQWPGTDFACRCTAEPIEEEILGMSGERVGVAAQVGLESG